MINIFKYSGTQMQRKQPPHVSAEHVTMDLSEGETVTKPMSIGVQDNWYLVLKDQHLEILLYNDSLTRKVRGASFPLSFLAEIEVGLQTASLSMQSMQGIN